MDRIADIFARCRTENRKALVMFVSCGCPDLATSEELIEKEIAAGADIIELGVPFSDPMADGAVIQAASQTALANGATFAGILEMAARIRTRHPQTGLVLFSYYNVLFQYGLTMLAETLGRVGIDAVLPVDLPYEEREELARPLSRTGIKLIPLISPLTPPERVEQITAKADAFVYYVMVCGVTGERKTLPPELAAKLAMVRKCSPVPVVAGFGVADGRTAHMVAQHADGVVVGSAAVHPLLEMPPEPAVLLIERLTRELSLACHSA